jgi:hypothetical protein
MRVATAVLLAALSLSTVHRSSSAVEGHGAREGNRIPLSLSPPRSPDAAARAAAAPLPHLPPVLSRRDAALAPSGFELVVDRGGGMSVIVGTVRFDVASGFSEVGPLWNNLTAVTTTTPVCANRSGGMSSGDGRAGASSSTSSSSGGGSSGNNNNNNNNNPCGDGGGGGGASAGPRASGWVVGPTVDATAGKTLGRWVVRATAVNFSLTRVFQLDPWPSPRRVLINDTITSLASAPVGVSVRHVASLDPAAMVGTAVVPGVLEADFCGTEDNPWNFGGTDGDAHALNAGAPHVWFNGTTPTTRTARRANATGDTRPSVDEQPLVGSVDTARTDASQAINLDTPSHGNVGGTRAGLGMVALDDVFRVHAECRNFAVPRLNPRVNSSCAVASPPAVRLSDPRFALPAGESHTLEWALYPFNDTCDDFFCFVNALRHDYGVEDMVIGVHTGVLAATENGACAEVDDMTQWARSGYSDPRCNNTLKSGSPQRLAVCKNWTEWPTDQLRAYVAIHFVCFLRFAFTLGFDSHQARKASELTPDSLLCLTSVLHTFAHPCAHCNSLLTSTRTCIPRLLEGT